MLFPPGLPRSKRLLDLLICVLALILTSPITLLTTIAVRFALGTPVLFRQLRPGYLGHPFHILKFRTMSDATDADGNLLPDSLRLVGPRPLLMEYLARYSPEQMRRHDVYPGLTGWAQVHGRNALTWQDKFRLDVWYVDNWTFWLDIKILLLTLWKVLTREGISQPGQATTEFFMGNEPREN
jgi:sugar transferase EpsL